MDVEIIVTPTFERDFKKLAKKYPSIKHDIEALEDYLIENPTPEGYSIGGNLYKIRLKITSLKKGKSGGARVITVVDTVIKDSEVNVYLARIYEKSEKEDLTPQEYTSIKKMYTRGDN